MKKAKVRKDSLVQTTTQVVHEPEADYFDPRLFIVSHKTKSFLGDQIRAGNKMEHFEDYLKPPKGKFFQEAIRSKLSLFVDTRRISLILN